MHTLMVSQTERSKAKFKGQGSLVSDTEFLVFTPCHLLSLWKIILKYKPKYINTPYDCYLNQQPVKDLKSLSINNC